MDTTIRPNPTRFGTVGYEPAGGIVLVHGRAPDQVDVAERARDDSLMGSAVGRVDCVAMRANPRTTRDGVEVRRGMTRKQGNDGSCTVGQPDPDQLTTPTERDQDFEIGTLCCRTDHGNVSLKFGRDGCVSMSGSRSEEVTWIKQS